MKRHEITRCPSRGVAVLLYLTLLAPVAAQGPPPGKPPAERIQDIEQRMEKHAQSLPPQERQAWQLLQRMIHADLTQPFIGREIRQVAQGKETEQWVRVSPERGVRIEGIRPDNFIVLDTRQQAFFYDPHKKQWYSHPSGMPILRGIFREALHRLDKGELKAKLDGQDTIAGRACSIVRVAPADGAPGPSHRFWIDRATGLRLKMEIVGQDGHIFTTNYFLSVDLTPRFGPDDFTPPANAISRDREHETPDQSYKTLAEAQQAHVDMPDLRYVPAGFTLKKIEIFGQQSRRPRVTLRYSNGLSAISLTQFKADRVPPRLRDHVMEHGPGFLPNPQGNGERAYLWPSNDNGVFILLSSLPDDEVKRIADQVKP